jgi:glycine/D-amino acid oxidase-like deaminating enzyme
MLFDCLIVGQGLAGTVLAHTAEAKGFKIMLADNKKENTSSRVSAGLFNPITGRNLQQTWLAKEIFPFAVDFYTLLEKKLGAKIFHQKNLYRILSSNAEQNDWAAQDQTFGVFNDAERPQIAAPFGGINASPAGYADLPALLAASENYFSQKGIFLNKDITPESIKREGENFVWNNFQFKKIIWARGLEDATSAMWSFLPFRPNRGEMLYIDIEGEMRDEIYSSGVWLLPFHEGFYKLGSTHDRDNLDLTTTAEGKIYLEDKIKKFLTANIRTRKQIYGVRPTTVDRKPFIGEHFSEKGNYIFNGFGAKGVSLTPYFADEFSDYLLGKKNIHHEANIARFGF